jgi:hypothetical protein
MSNDLSPDERTRWFDLGKIAGRKEMLEEIHKALGIDEAIAKAISTHEEQNHG